MATTDATAEFRPGFVSHQELADLLFCRLLRRVGPGVVEAGGQGFALRQAVRVIERSGGGPDPRGMAGGVQPLGALRAAGAVIDADRMSLGNETYRIERGVLAVRAPRPRSPLPSAP